MEYTDYRTGKDISREQYIKNGLERGELVLKEVCGCVVIQDRTAGAYIVYCPTHKVAPDMYEACKSAYAWYYEGQSGDYKVIGEHLRKALAKAEVN